MAELYLLREELNVITGFRQKKKQCAWLKKERIEFRENALGYPIVSRAYWETSQGREKRKTDNQPRWDA